MRTGENTVWHWDVSIRARIVARVSRILVKPLFTVWPTGDRGLRALGKLDAYVDTLPIPPGAVVTPLPLGGVRCERVVAGRAATDDLADATILYLHGGGFVFCGLGTHRSLCALLSARAGVPVVSVAYRQLPDGGIGTSIADAMAAYRALLDTCPDPTKIIVAGDSAGGYLAMKIAELAATQGLTRPAAVIGYSPLLNVHLERHDAAFMRKDAYLPIRKVAKLKNRWLGGPDRITGVDSPVDVEPALLPPVFLSCAEYELMRPDVELLTHRLEQVGHPVETHIWSGQIHAFPVLGTILRESREIVSLSVGFARGSLANRQRRTA